MAAEPLRQAAQVVAKHDVVTAVIQHEVRADARADYERWIERIGRAAAAFPGHRGLDVVRPAGDGPARYMVATRFDSLRHAQRWFASRERQLLIDEASRWLVRPETIATLSGIEFWFETPSGHVVPQRWKQFLVTFVGIYPLTLVFPALLNAAPSVLPAPLQHAAGTAMIVASMVWVVMPRLTRWTARWLYEGARTVPPKNVSNEAKV